MAGCKVPPTNSAGHKDEIKGNKKEEKGEQEEEEEVGEEEEEEEENESAREKRRKASGSYFFAWRPGGITGRGRNITREAVRRRPGLECLCNDSMSISYACPSHSQRVVSRHPPRPLLL
ncbi:hypothetical protein E2C01_086230 [Portunus trituberculatus]|uniref:Uncharacterized protein n=1 Tax=Portunus trituberculatus TaxID=210409 RepID=A0A5B7J386_PORTR|nr:hypothetical protein [Portunus trituberculatus]